MNTLNIDNCLRQNNYDSMTIRFINKIKYCNINNDCWYNILKFCNIIHYPPPLILNAPN